MAQAVTRLPHKPEKVPGYNARFNPVTGVFGAVHLQAILACLILSYGCIHSDCLIPSFSRQALLVDKFLISAKADASINGIGGEGQHSTRVQTILSAKSLSSGTTGMRDLFSSVFSKISNCFHRGADVK